MLVDRERAWDRDEPAEHGWYPPVGTDRLLLAVFKMAAEKRWFRFAIYFAPLLLPLVSIFVLRGITGYVQSIGLAVSFLVVADVLIFIVISARGLAGLRDLALSVSAAQSANARHGPY